MDNTPHLLRTVTAAVAIAALCTLPACSSKTPLDQAPLAGARIGGDFTLVDKAGTPRTWVEFKGKWRVVYFGFTNCPDACPLDLQILMKGFGAFAKANPQLAATVQPIFITIDPSRDTPARVGEFAAAFSPRLLGLSGSPEAVAAVTKSFAVYAARGEDMPGGGYNMNHSRIAYLFDPDGKPIAVLPVDKGMKDGPDAVAAELAKWLR